MEKIRKSEEEWRRELTPEQYRILRQKGTEPPGTGKYYHETSPGIYRCAACGQPLFDAVTKYESGSGWPSFYQPIMQQNVSMHEDRSHGMIRT
ncbi:MAG: peptide-methionine (R)-S-oxide reductase MsrB, partial [Candidatus Cloacimonetes bacterium]|nr:peptide-methionine (R)-S-oxide reductase MsrB [Candidatus Cloacimonadota bacterium]